MQKLILVLAISALSFPGPTNCENNNAEVPPVKATLLVDLEDEEVADNVTNPETVAKCEQTDYRSYVKCLMEESSRKKRQCGLSGVNCAPVVQGQCIGAGCLRGITPQLPCAETGCDRSSLGPNCIGTGCGQTGQTCYGIGCVPVTNVQTPCVGYTGCNVVPGPSVKVDTNELRRDISEIREQLRVVKKQNEKLIQITERATTMILESANRPLPEPRIIREPFVVEHNLTTSIDISNYLNNTNVINVPKTSREPVEESKQHCCTVVRPKTCHRTSRPPYFICAHKRHRTCGSHCSGRRVVHSQVRPGCGGDSTENCVSYDSYPHYPTSGYHPPAPIYYPIYPIYAPPPMPVYPNSDDTEYLDEDCEDCESEEETGECEDRGDQSCKRVPKKGVRHSGLIRSRSISQGDVDLVKKEALAIKRSEDQLTASIDMLQEAVELKTIEENRGDEGKSAKEMKTDGGEKKI